MRSILIASTILALAGCANSGTGSISKPPPQTMQVDLQRYQGTWYELARLPMFFQRNCVQSQAHYGLRDDGRIDVTNRCRDKDGEWIEAKGVAEPQVEGQTDKLWVRFDNWASKLLPIKGDYWVIYHDEDYRVALVGHPEHKYLWLLSRTPDVDQETRDKLLSVAREQGYVTSDLIWRQAD
ncbi:lipocalin family protein [Pseudomonas sp. 8O]|uniref:lipocalin family protein n=1 Tax=Pseudomonas sp. 8O TaxID=2653165 RepID=UPI0012F16C19|nr:lipocalin family protein [Pseudomonas sp. 8O]VXB04339.1 Outer membrane lipoprotein Blc [Pseudomonas sp. 8O]